MYVDSIRSGWTPESRKVRNASYINAYTCSRSFHTKKCVDAVRLRPRPTTPLDIHVILREVGYINASYINAYTCSRSFHTKKCVDAARPRPRPTTPLDIHVILREVGY